MFPQVVGQGIEDVVERIPLFSGNGVELKRFARAIAEAYLQKIEYADTLFPRDVALAAIFLASTEMGPALSMANLALAAKEDLIAWPNVAEDMRERLHHLKALSQVR